MHAKIFIRIIFSLILFYQCNHTVDLELVAETDTENPIVIIKGELEIEPPATAGADLVFSNLIVPTIISPDISFELLFNIKNNGDEIHTAGFDIICYFQEFGQVKKLIGLLATYANNLSPGELLSATNIVQNYTIQATNLTFLGLAESTNYKIILEVKSKTNSGVIEPIENEYNNLAETTYSTLVESRVDLIIDSITVDPGVDTLSPYDDFVYYNIKNIGSADSTNITTPGYRVKLILSSSNDPLTAVKLKPNTSFIQNFNTILNPDQILVSSPNVTMNQLGYNGSGMNVLPAGPVYLIVYVDYDDKQLEYDEKNNATVYTIKN